MARDEFSAPTKRLLAQQAGYVCSFENCLAPTSGPTLDGNSSVNLGVAAHICGASKDGPRYDPNMTKEQRTHADNGIWMCVTHASLIDKDEDRFTTERLRSWKQNAEDRALKMVGRPQGCASGSLAFASPVVRLGAEYCVLVDGEPVPHTDIFDVDEPDCSVTFFGGAYVVQFSIQKRQNLKNAILEHLTVTVHETEPVPNYQPLLMIYPTEVSFFYVEIDVNNGTVPREFVPTRYYTKKNGDEPERFDYPNPLVLDDDIPAQIALRLNAKTSAKYLISMSAVVSSGEQREVLDVMPEQWVIFERHE